MQILKTKKKSTGLGNCNVFSFHKVTKYCALFEIYKSFIKADLGYGNILYEKPNNENFVTKKEEIQY